MKDIFVDGKFQKALAQESREIVNPATESVIDRVPQCGAADVDLAVMAARRAHGSWAKVPGGDKAKLLHEIATKIRGLEKELAPLITKESGKPLCESFDCIEWVAAVFDYYAEIARSERGRTLPPVAPHQVNFVIKEPYGVVAAIVPFNFPLLLMSWKVAPAIAAGNTVVCKAPHQNPLSNLLFAKVYDGLPPGVVNVITGDATTGDALVRHSEVDLIAFTGSTATGRKIAAIAGQDLKKVNLEMGGIDPFLVCEDADLEVASRGVAWARLLNAGQVCTSSKRIYLVREIAADFTERLLKHVRGLRVGDPAQPSTDIGPLITKDAVEKVESQVKAAIREGAECVMGGKRMTVQGKGYYFEPTVLTNVKHGSLPTTEEIFGPVISLITVRDVDEGIRLCNDSKYGLGASIYTNRMDYAMRAMEEIKAGTFWINDPLTDNDAGPFGGMRWSGIGRELGEDGLNAFRESKHVHLDYNMETKPYWFPYLNRPVPSEH